MRPIIVLEFNELCPPLLDKWMKSGDLPNFQKLYKASSVFTTFPDTESSEELEPWIQWYSVHTGLSYADHGVFNLTDGPRMRNEDIWSLLHKGGYRTANWSSMNARVSNKAGSFGIPDPWCVSEKSNPADIQIFQDFVQRRVQEYTNDENRTAFRDAIQLLVFLARRGLRFSTVTAIIRQFIQESLSDVAWKRVVILDWLLFDIFKHYWQSMKPDYSTFFLNSTAHFQHAYWRHMDPGAFQNLPPEAEQKKFKDAVKFGYENMDKLIGEFLKLERQSGGTLVLMSALSQQPFLKYETIGGQRFYRPRNINTLLNWLSVTPQRVEPVMTHQYMLSFETEAQANEAKLKLDDVKLMNDTVFASRADGTSVFMGCQIRSCVPKGERLKVDSRTAEFLDFFYLIDASKSGCHHPDGVLWVRTGHHRKYKEPVSILDWFPTVLDIFQLDIPVDIQGQSLRPQLGLMPEKYMRHLDRDKSQILAS